MTPAVRTFVAQYDVSSKRIGLFGTVNKTGIETVLQSLAELISKEKAQDYPVLPLRRKDLVADVLPEKIDVFHQEMTGK